MQTAFNLARLDLVSMRRVLSCGTTGSLSAAALECHLSLMGASERLRRVEDLFGMPLFHRHRRGLTPTEAGKVFIERSEDVLAVVNIMAAEVKAAQVTPATQKENRGRGRRRILVPKIPDQVLVELLADLLDGNADRDKRRHQVSR